MKTTFYIAIFFFVFQLQAQKVIEKEIDLQNISSVVINGNQIFKIRINANTTKTILVQAKFEGEYNEDIVLLTEKVDSKLTISTEFQPLFVPHNDKLSAHKVISIELSISLPEYLNVWIQSDIASVLALGQYNNLTIELVNGNCKVDSFSGNAIINTIHGAINVSSDDAKVVAHTKKGILKQDKLRSGKKTLNLNSINGNITVTKTE